VSLAKAVTWGLEHEPILIWSFFFGLVLASAVVVRKRIRKWGVTTFAALLIGGVGAFVLVGVVPAQTPETLPFVFISGSLAICAMILPGISGAFILLLLGKYEYIINALLTADVGTIVVFALGCLVGLVTFAQLLSWLFHRYHNVTVALLIGLMIGSLRKVWPWKVPTEYFTDRHGELQPLAYDNLLPAIDAHLALAIGCAVVGFAAVILLEKFGATEEKER
jgi:putative membrane protein